MNIDPSMILDRLHEKRISIWAVARKMETDSAHIRRVLAGDRQGSAALLNAIWETVQSMRGRSRPRRAQDDLDRLVSAAVHVFFVQRGDFESAVFSDPADVSLYGPHRPRPKETSTRRTGLRRAFRDEAAQRESKLASLKQPKEATPLQIGPEGQLDSSYTGVESRSWRDGTPGAPRKRTRPTEAAEFFITLPNPKTG